MLLPMVSLPFIASLIAGIMGRFIGIKGTNYIVVGSLIISTLLSLIIGYEVVLAGSSFSLKLGTWFDTGMINIDWGFVIDPLGAWLTSTVLVISTLVHVFATSYMAGDPAPQRFMSLLVGFTAFMVILVTGDSLGTLFLGWEGIGITSFLLIGYWWDRSAACNAAGQALITNRVGDASFTIALLILICSTKSLDLNMITACFYNSPINLSTVGLEDVDALSKNVINWAGLLLVIAAFGKSAQFILHTWLPQAMEGPTPVSALLHAATLVAGGIYLLIRCSAIVGASTWALLIATIFGTITAIFAGTTALFQNDAKRIIAYSTCSQFGYLTASIGVGQTGSTLFHLSSHAGFKALLFVCAGGVLHSMSDEQDIRRLGGLIYTLPFTYTALLVGSLSLIATPYLSGFYSKDMILELAASQLTISGTWFWVLGSIVAGITGCYSIKLLAYIFLGSPEAGKRSYEQAHEQSTGIIIPIIILSLLALTFGYFAKESIIGFGTDVTPIYLANINAASALPLGVQNLVGAEFGLKGIAKLLPLILTLCGVIAGVILFVLLPSLFAKLAKKYSLLGSSLSNKWWADIIIARKIVWPFFDLGLFSSKIVDKGLVEIIGPWGFTLTLYPQNPDKIWSISSFATALPLGTHSLGSLPLGDAQPASQGFNLLNRLWVHKPTEGNSLSGSLTNKSPQSPLFSSAPERLFGTPEYKERLEKENIGEGDWVQEDSVLAHQLKDSIAPLAPLAKESLNNDIEGKYNSISLVRSPLWRSASNPWIGNILPAYSSYIVLFGLLAVFSTTLWNNIFGGGVEGDAIISLPIAAIWSIVILSFSRSSN